MQDCLENRIRLATSIFASMVAERNQGVMVIGYVSIYHWLAQHVTILFPCNLELIMFSSKSFRVPFINYLQNEWDLGNI